MQILRFANEVVADNVACYESRPGPVDVLVRPMFMIHSGITPSVYGRLITLFRFFLLRALPAIFLTASGRY